MPGFAHWMPVAACIVLIHRPRAAAKAARARKILRHMAAGGPRSPRVRRTSTSGYGQESKIAEPDAGGAVPEEARRPVAVA